MGGKGECGNEGMRVRVRERTMGSKVRMTVGERAVGREVREELGTTTLKTVQTRPDGTLSGSALQQVVADPNLASVPSLASSCSAQPC